MSTPTEVIVIGAGPGGYVAAIRCAQLGMKVSCIDRWLDENNRPVQGGTCLNVGCIPSKALLDSSHHYAAAGKLANHGVRVGELGFDLPQMMKRKMAVVDQLRHGVGGLLKAAGVKLLAGSGRLLADRQVEFSPHDGKPQILNADAVILAPGSVPIDISAAAVNGREIVDSSGALCFDEVPRQLAIIGAGVIGLELGSVWARLGAEVVILEALDNFLPAVDAQIAAEAAKVFAKQGLDIRLGCQVEAAQADNEGVLVSYRGADGKSHEQRCDRLVVAVGRRPETAGLFSDDSGVVLEGNGAIRVNGYCETAVEAVYAVGDAVRGPMLAHKASEEGVMVAGRISGKDAQMNYDCVPGVIYTHPEIAWVGHSEQSLAAAGRTCKSGTFPFAASGRAIAAGETDGLVKLLADTDTDAILGCHIIGPAASDLIQQVVIAMEFEGVAEDLALTVFGHPTFSEALHEAALAVDGQAIHLPKAPSRPRRKRR